MSVLPRSPLTALPVLPAVLPVTVEDGALPLCGRIRLPFAAGRHPDTDAIGPEVLGWLGRCGLLDARTGGAFARARFHELAGRVYHRGDRGALRLAADFIAALFVLDDLMDTAIHPACREEGAARAALLGLRGAARTGEVPDVPPVFRPVAVALADLRRRLDARGAPCGGWLDELDAYLDGVIEEARRRAVGYRSVADYARVRVAFSAVYACVELGLACEGARLTPALRPLARAANLSVSYVNDLYSWPKERALGERSNLVAVLAAQRRLSERQAWEAACRACDEVATGYLRLRAGVPAAERGALPLLEAWMRGNYDWHALATERYSAALSVAPPDAGI